MRLKMGRDLPLVKTVMQSVQRFLHYPANRQMLKKSTSTSNDRYPFTLGSDVIGSRTGLWAQRNPCCVLAISVFTGLVRSPIQ